MKHTRIEHQFNLNLVLQNTRNILLAIWFIPSVTSAQIAATEQAVQANNESKFSYTIGTRFKSNDFSEIQHTARIRPVLGLRYGKWQLGIGDGSSWLREGKYGAEPTLSYQFFENPDVNVGLSMRVHNVSTGESFDVFEGGKTTLRTRLMIHQKISKRWHAQFDWTQDLLNKGDGTTLTTGLSYSWPVFSQSELILNFGSTWATAEHWKNSNLPMAPGKNHVFQAGFEKVNAGVTFKQAMTRNWAWYSSLSVTAPIADLKRMQDSREVVSGQIGILYFKR
jgi:hypothetical protein